MESNRFLYLDPDVLVCSSVQPLFKMLGENLIAAAARDYYFYDIFGSKLQERSPELPKHALYSNSGVNQANSEAWRNRKVSERGHRLSRFSAGRRSRTEVSDAFNVVVARRSLKELGLIGNVQLGAFGIL